MSEEQQTVKVELVKPWYKRWWVWGIAIFLLIGIASGGGDQPATKSNTAQEASQEKPEEKDTAVKLNQPLQVGEVKWVATKVEKMDILKSSNEYQDSAKPNGVFVKVDLTAELTGTESGTIDGNQLKIIDSKGRKFSDSSNFDVSVILGDRSIVLKQVNPNVPINGSVVFDVAKDATGLKLEIEDLRFTSDDKGLIDLGI